MYSTPIRQPVIGVSLSGACRHDIEASVSPDSISWVPSIDAFVSSLPQSEAGLLVFPERRHFPLSPLLEAVSQCVAKDRVLIIAPLTADVARTLMAAGTPPEQVVWTEEVTDQLADRLRAIGLSDPLVSLELVLSGPDGLPPILVTALRRLVEGCPPPTTIVGLAEAIGVKERTLRYHWRKGLADVTPKSVLDWVVLVRATQRAERAGWRRSASWLGVHERTLERIATRCMDSDVRHQRLLMSTVRAALERWWESLGSKNSSKSA